MRDVIRNESRRTAPTPFKLQKEIARDELKTFPIDYLIKHALPIELLYALAKLPRDYFKVWQYWVQI